VRWVPGIADRIAAVLPADHVYEIAVVETRAKQGQRTDYARPSLYLQTTEAQGYGGVSMYAVDPSYLRQFGDVGRQAADALQAGKVVTRKSRFAPKARHSSRWASPTRSTVIRPSSFPGCRTSSGCRNPA
jgi:hypothetical protein